MKKKKNLVVIRTSGKRFRQARLISSCLPYILKEKHRALNDMFKFCVCLYVRLCVCMHAFMHVCVCGVVNLNMWKIVICFQKTRILNYVFATY